MYSLFKLTGIFSELFLFGLTVLCMLKDRSFHYKDDAFSYLGISKKTKHIFNIGLIVYTVMRVLFIGTIMYHLSFWKNSLIVFIYLGSFLTIIIPALFPWDRYPEIHDLAARGILITSAFFVLCIGIQLINTHTALASINIVAFILLVSLGLWSLRQKKVNGYPHMFTYFCIFVWDIAMTIFLFL